MSSLQAPFIPDPILWHDGMLLSPEHFHELQARAEVMLERISASLRFHWGVYRLQIDEAQLTRGKVVLLELEAFLPDGFYVRVLRREEPYTALDLQQLDATFQQRPFMLFLAVPALTEGDSRAGRYTEAGGDVSMLEATLDDEESVPIPRLRPRFHLLAAFEAPSSKFVSIPLARVAVRNETWVLLDTYQAPVPVLPPTGNIFTEADRLLRRTRELAIMQHTQWERLSADQRKSSDADQRNAWRTLVTRLPALEALLAAQHVPPFELYLSLCTFAGAVAGLTAEAVPPFFPPYAHADITASFAPVLEYLRSVLNREEGNAYTGFPFRFEHDVFALTFAPEWTGRALVLAVRGQREDDAGTRAWVEAALIGAESLQKSLRDRRILGASRSSISGKQGLLTAPGTLLFELAANPEFVRPGEPLEVRSGPRNDVGRQPLELTLYVQTED